MKNKRFLIFIYVVALAACIMFVYVFPSIGKALEGTYIVEHGSVEVYDEVDSYIVRNETVYTAGKDCFVKTKADEGKLVRVGVPIVTISEGGKEEASNTYTTLIETLDKAPVPTEDGLSKNAGYVSYKVDGAETVLNHDSIAKMKRETLEKYAAARLVKAAGGKCAKSEPLFKIVENGDWWLVYYVDSKTIEKYYEGQRVDLTIDDETVSAHVESISPKPVSDEDEETEDGEASEKKDEAEPVSEYRIVLCCSVFVKDYMTMRTAKIKVTTSGGEGLKIQNKSIVEKKGKKGVLVKNKYGKNVFKPIKILAADDKYSIISEERYLDASYNFVDTVKIYDEILTSPSEKDVKNAE